MLQAWGPSHEQRTTCVPPLHSPPSCTHHRSSDPSHGVLRGGVGGQQEAWGAGEGKGARGEGEEVRESAGLRLHRRATAGGRAAAQLGHAPSRVHGLCAASQGMSSGGWRSGLISGGKGEGDLRPVRRSVARAAIRLSRRTPHREQSAGNTRQGGRKHAARRQETRGEAAGNTRRGVRTGARGPLRVRTGRGVRGPTPGSTRA